MQSYVSNISDGPERVECHHLLSSLDAKKTKVKPNKISTMSQLFAQNSANQQRPTATSQLSYYLEHKYGDKIVDGYFMYR